MERYRALNDAMDEAYELFDLSNREVRFRPGQFRPRLTNWPPDRDDYPKGVRYYEDVVERDVEEHWSAWKDVTVMQLNAELAVQVYSLCLKNKARKLALRGLYRSLRILTILFAVILTMFIAFSWL